MKAVALALVLTAACSAALADWQNTRWGMSLDEVQAQFKDAVPITRLIPAVGEPDVMARLYADPAPDQHVTFWFRRERLVRVDVDYAQLRDCPAVLDKLRAQFGPPIATERVYEVLSVFTWLSGRDEITLRWLESGNGTGICGLVQKSSFGG